MPITVGHDSSKTRKTLKVGDTSVAYYSIAAAEEAGLGDFSKLPAAQDWATGEAVRVVDPLTPESLAAAMREWLEDDNAYARAAAAARTMELPTWEYAARTILSTLQIQ